ncbi:hypothetical protein GH714_037491 [Hevea brasiliensis]|uniref:Uncharacterized protein n=1 Tax=Hevea brasiliensis TaxID=3981 RepID=A0A6A6KL16_HEVBR|nr:hypothetical protein GH714_037491 [Hevea brasiliensis]
MRNQEGDKIIRHEEDFDHDGSSDDLSHDVKNGHGILQVAVELGCPQIVVACVNYLEAVPWEEAEEEILRIMPGMGLQAEPILASLQPVNPSTIRRITGDDDAPLLSADDKIKSIVTECVEGLFSRFNNLLDTLFFVESVSEVGTMRSFQSHLSDFSLAYQILSKLEIMLEFVKSWVDASDKILKVAENTS